MRCGILVYSRLLDIPASVYTLFHAIPPHHINGHNSGMDGRIDFKLSGQLSSLSNGKITASHAEGLGSIARAAKLDSGFHPQGSVKSVPALLVVKRLLCSCRGDVWLD